MTIAYNSFTHDIMPIYTFEQTQKIPATLQQVWEFISSPQNLKHITPEYMGFDIITRDLPAKMYPGMIITYKVSPLRGVKTTWVTEITHMKEGEYFVDEQRVGPYKMWHHQHRIEPIEGGVLMKDIVNYRPPLGLLGAIANRLIIRKKLEEIFLFRTLKLDERFGKMA